MSPQLVDSRGGMKFGLATPAPRQAWAEVAADDPHAMVTQSPQWLDAMTGTGRFEDASRLYTLSDGRRYVVPMVRYRGAINGLAGATSYPNAWGAGGIVGAGLDVEVASQILGDVIRDAPLRMQIRPNPLMASTFASAMPDRAIATSRRAHIVDLADDAHTQWTDALTSAGRRSIRKAERSNLEVECDTTGRLVGEFHELFSRSVERWAAAQHEPLRLAQWRASRRDSRSKWETIARSLGGACQIWVARQDHVPIASIVVLQGTTAHYTRGAMDKERAAPVCANHLLMWRAIQDAIDNGCSEFHMGETGGSVTLSRFKEQFGAVAYDHADYLIERLPLSKVDALARRVVKRVIRFKD